MFNKIKKNMNMNMKPNRTNKIMILLSLFLILLNESNNIVYAMITPNKQAGKILHAKQKKKQKQRDEKLKKIKEGLSENINLKSNDSGLSFINNSDNEATIKLDGIADGGSVTFKNNDNNENGSFKVELGSSVIKARILILNLMLHFYYL